MLRPPSLQHTYDEFYSGDESFVQPPPAPGKDATPDDRLAYEAAVLEHERKVQVARLTGHGWAELQIAGKEPTKFTMRTLPGDVFRSIVDRVTDGTIGGATANLLLVRAALVGVSNLPGYRDVRFAVDPQYPGLGKIATVEIPNVLDSCDPRIVAELGGAIRDRAMGIRPL